VAIFGIVTLTTWAVEDIRVVKVGESFDLGPYQVQLMGMSDQKGPNYTAKVADMRVTKNGAEVAMMHPAKRTYPIAGMATTEAAIWPGIFGDIYLVVGDPQDGGGYAVRSYLKPFALWLWLGGMMMALGGMLSLSDRRFRVAAGARRSTDVAVAAE
jgi:cytochrome c-type biogenesis protein CcmF